MPDENRPFTWAEIAHRRRQADEDHPQEVALRAWDRMTPEDRARTAAGGGFTITGRKNERAAGRLGDPIR